MGKTDRKPKGPEQSRSRVLGQGTGRISKSAIAFAVGAIHQARNESKRECIRLRRENETSRPRPRFFPAGPILNDGCDTTKKTRESRTHLLPQRVPIILRRISNLLHEAVLFPLLHVTLCDGGRMALLFVLRGLFVRRRLKVAKITVKGGLADKRTLLLSVRKGRPLDYFFDTIGTDQLAAFVGKHICTSADIVYMLPPLACACR